MASQKAISLLEFQERFATDEGCHEQLFKMRWPDGFRCPRCGCDRYYWLRARHLYQCLQCRYQVSVTAGTIFHRSRVPLRKWFWAILVTQDKRGISALLVSRTLRLRYETAWFMLYKIRQAMQNREEQYQLQGLVEMDDGYFGGVDHGRARGRGVNRPRVIVAVGVRKKRPTYAKMTVVERVSKDAIAGFTTQACAPDAVIKTDGFNCYAVLDDIGFQHLPVAAKDHPEGAAAFPYVHTLISNAKAWLTGTFHGGIRNKYLPRYLDEFCYRFNRRGFSGEGFSRLLQVCATMAPTTYAELTG